MQLTNLRSDARYLVFGNSSNTAYADTDLDRNLNRWYQSAIGWALSVNGIWQVQGTFATASIVAGQSKYEMPSDILKLDRVEIKSPSSNDYIVAKQIDHALVGTNLDDYHPDSPEFDLLGNYMYIYLPDASITAVTAGIKIIYQCDITELSGATDEPLLPEVVQRVVSTGAAYDYCRANDMFAKADRLNNEIAKIKVELEEIYANRSTVEGMRMEPCEDDNY
jgi:hypothetical protein